jgi:hypothetical protein
MQKEIDWYYKLITMRNLLFFFNRNVFAGNGFMPIPVVTRSKARVCGHSLARIAVLNPVEGLDVCCECCVLSVVCSKALNQNFSGGTEDMP